MGKQVAYCYSCERKTNLSKRKLIIDGAVPRDKTDNLETQTLVTDNRTKSVKDSFLTSDLNDDLDSSASEDDPIIPQEECKKKKRGRKAKWSQSILDDLVDIIISSEQYKKKLIFTNQKNQRNGDIYEKVLAELKKRVESRGEEVPFNSNQVRTKFKKCVSECKSVALTIKTATGIDRFIEQKDYGKWFNDLFAIVKTRDACRPELALEPSGSEESLTILEEDEPSTSSSSGKKEKVQLKKIQQRRCCPF
ncbi:uncharacterized protein LOC114517677 isoform X2 [Dendronephthya gigantea]|uniref:uncharacterized protein LOC114517677 isoform X2 n=1 Tax=Dendronephthya gigantea TaxID=151771 RepID=UPI00106C339D|nr:uncharacterized protein LOC114517677 isoform X2 [Dendronephthya gigantea]